MGKGKKRKHFYNDVKDAKRWKGVLSVGMKGFLCTCNMRTKECIREAYNLLNTYAEKTILPEEEKVEGESIEDELEKELLDMRKKPSEKMFQVVDTGADNTVFIRTTINDPVKLANEIFTDVFTKKQNNSRFLLRLVPIEVTCKAYIDDIRKTVDGMLDLPFKCDPLTFNVFYKARYNSSLLRDEVLAAIVTLVKDRNPMHKVDLTTPQKTVIVEVIKGVCCLSIVTDFYKHRKFNLLEAAKGEHAEAAKILEEVHVTETIAPSVVDPVAASVTEGTAPCEVGPAATSVSDDTAPSRVEAAATSVSDDTAPSRVEPAAPSVTEDAAPSEVEPAALSVTETIAPSKVKPSAPSVTEDSASSIAEDVVSKAKQHVENKPAS